MASNDFRATLAARLLPLLLGVLVLAFYAARGCQEGPFGRTQIVQMTPDQESRLGAQAYAEILSQSRVVEGGETAEVVHRVGRRLARASEDPALREAAGIRWKTPFDWQFRVVADRQINAFCLPGGKVVVFTGILPVCQTEAGLATVMGHEIGHALFRHGAERMAQRQMVQIGQVAVAASVRDLEPSQQRTVFAVLGAGAQYGVLMPYSRAHETEADRIGMLLMARAGYNPAEAARFWTRMARHARGAGSEFFSTHPSHETRIRDLENYLEQGQARAFYARSAKREDTPLPDSASTARSPAR